MNTLDNESHPTALLLNKAGLLSNYYKIKTNFRLCANEWIGNSDSINPEDLSNFTNNVIKREFQFRNDFMQSLVEEVSKPVEDYPHVIVKVDNLKLDNQSKKSKENFNLECWLEVKGHRITASPVDDLSEESVGGFILPNFNQYPDQNQSRFGKQIAENLELVVLKKEGKKKGFAKNMLHVHKTVKSLGKVKILLSDAYKGKHSSHCWPINHKGVNVGTINLTFDFVNQNIFRASDAISKKIVDEALSVFDYLWSIKKEERTSKRMGISGNQESVYQNFLANQEFHNSEKMRITDVQYFVKVSTTAANLTCNIDSSIDTDEAYGDQSNCEPRMKTEDDKRWRISSISNMSDILMTAENSQCLIPVKRIPVKSFMDDQISISLQNGSDKTVPTQKISVCNIPWRYGMDLTDEKHQCKIELLNNYKLVCNDLRGFIEMIKSITFLVYYHELLSPSEEEIGSCTGWDSRNVGGGKMILNSIALSLNREEWKEVKAYCFLKLVSINKSLNADILTHPAMIQSLKTMRKENDAKQISSNNFLSNEEKTNICQAFIQYGLQTLSTVDYCDIKNDEKMQLPAIESIINGLILFHEKEDNKLRSALTECLFQVVSSQYSSLTPFPERFEFKNILDTISTYETYTKFVHTRFGMFGADIWSPSLASSCFYVLVPVIQNKTACFEACASSTNAGSLRRAHEAKDLYLIYIKLKSLYEYCKTCDCGLMSACYSIFEPHLSSWVAVAYETAESQIKRVLELQKEKFKKQSDQGPLPEQRNPTKDIQIKHFEEVEGAIDVGQIFHTYSLTWENLDWNDKEINAQIGASMFVKLQFLLDLYIQGLKDIFLENTILNIHELVMILKSVFHLQQQYFGVFWAKLRSQIQNVRESRKIFEKCDDIIAPINFNIEHMIKTLINRYAQGQKEFLKSFLNQPYPEAGPQNHNILKTSLTTKMNRAKNLIIKPEEIQDDNGDGDKSCYVEKTISASITEMNYHISSAISYFEEELKSYSTELNMNDQSLIDFAENWFKTQIFLTNSDNLEEYYLKKVCHAYKKTKDNNVFYELNYMLEKESELRKRHSMQESNSLSKILQETTLKTSSSSILILKYMQCLYDKLQSEKSNVGTLTYQKGLIQDTLSVVIVLRSISGVRPRDKRETCDFCIELSVHPVNTNSGSRKTTPVYYQKRHCLFDLDEDVKNTNENIKEEQSSHTFVFPLKQLDTTRSSENNKFIEFRLYDQSQTRTRKYLLGHFLLPIEKFERFNTIDEFKAQIDNTTNTEHFRNYDIHHIFNLNFYETLVPIWNELKTRKDNFSRHFIDAMDYKMEKYREL